MNTRARITITFTSDWLASTGGTGGGDFDDLVQRGPDGLPIVPMSSVKGVLRETADRLVEAGVAGWDETVVNDLFGTRSSPANPQPTTPGALIFSGDARLSDAERAAFHSNKPARAALFTRRASTAINEDRGTARARTLRTVEAAVPMQLEGIVRLDDAANGSTLADWIAKLKAAAGWTLAIGNGKADGLGRALLQVDADDRPTPEIAAGGTTPVRRLVIELVQTEKATFSVRSATEGAHDTRLYVPGSALLGWAARNYPRYHEPYDVFHGGKVRFGDARPLADNGDILWPMPRVVREPKHQRGGIDAGGRLVADTCTIRDPRDNVQREPVGAPLVTKSGQTATPPTKLALRTAMQDGRPVTGQLFGYVSLTATPDMVTNRRYRAEIEIDPALNEHDCKLLRDAFDGTELFLGRARSAGQGGVFHSRVLEQASAGTEPPQAPKPHQGRVAVCAVSDLALVDAYGEAELAPSAQAFGLGAGCFVAADSAISSRRYAPWNAHLNTRDVERCVIEAGSVLVFDIMTPEKSWPTAVGLYQELGLGRIWIDPPLLQNLLLASPSRPQDYAIALDKADEPAAAAPNTPPKAVVTAATADPPLATWAKQRVKSRRTTTGILDQFNDKWLSTLEAFYAAEPAGDGPSRSQWNDVREAAAGGNEALRSRIETLDEAQQIAKGAAWQKEHGGERLRDWLKAQLSANMDVPTAQTLLKLAADAANGMAQRAKGRIG